MYYMGKSNIGNKPLTDHAVVLDLDQTLIYAYDDEDIEKLVEMGVFTKPEYFKVKKRIHKLTMDDVMEDKRGVGTKTEMWFVTRPHLDKFIRHCFEYFKVVAVWSAGRRKYVECIVDIIFRDIKRPHVIYTYDDCEWKNKRNPFIVKPIEKMIKNEPGLEKYMSMKNTFVIDDTKYTFAHTNKENGILIPAYHPKPSVTSILDDKDFVLEKLIDWFKKDEQISCPDIRTLNKSKIFK